MKAFGIFQGGGAQGVTHVGAYAAALTVGVRFLGVAGASAGAIVATLIAVGYQPKEIINSELSRTDSNRDILTRNGLSPVAVVGRCDWFYLSVARFLISHGSGVFLLLFAWLIFGGLLFLDIGYCPRFPEHREVFFNIFCALMLPTVLFALLLLLVVRRLSTYKGLLQPSRVEESVEVIIKCKVAEAWDRLGICGPMPKRLRFMDIDPWAREGCGFLQLKIAVTDLTNGRLILFGADNFPRASVSEVVAASVSIPLVFRPAKIESVPELSRCDFVDGGLVSNLPVWAFAEEKLREERRAYPHVSIPLLAFSLHDGPDLYQKHDSGAVWRFVVGLGRKVFLWRKNLMFRAYLTRAVRTGIFASQNVTHQFVKDLHVVELRSTLNVLDFNASWKAIRSGYFEGHHAALERVKSPFLAAERIASKMRSIHARVNELLLENHLPEWAGRVRLLIFVKVGRTSFRVAYHYNLGEDVDDQLILDMDCPGVPQAFVSRTPVGIMRTLEHTDPSRRVDLPMSKYEHASMWKNWRCAMCIPMFANPNEYEILPSNDRVDPVAVLSIDSDHDVLDTLNSDAVLPTLVKIASELVPFLDRRPE